MRAYPAEVKLECGLCDAAKLQALRKVRENTVNAVCRIGHIPAGFFRDHAEDPGRQDTDQHGTRNIIMYENKNDDEADQSERNLRRAEIAERHLCGIARNNDVRVLQSDESDKQADTRGNTVLEVCRNAVDDLLACFYDGKQNEDDAFHQNSGQADTERVFGAAELAQTYSVGKVGVQAKTCRQSNRIVGKKSHDEGCNRRGQRCRDKNTAPVHDSPENIRVDGKNVRHGQEGRKTCDDFCSGVGAVFT